MEPMKLAVRVIPNARTSEILGWEEDGSAGRVLKVRIAAPAVDGKANAALTAFLAKKLGIPKSKVVLAKGETSRVKQFTVPDGISLP